MISREGNDSGYSGSQGLNFDPTASADTTPATAKKSLLGMIDADVTSTWPLNNHSFSGGSHSLSPLTKQGLHAPAHDLELGLAPSWNDLSSILGIESFHQSSCDKTKARGTLEVAVR